MSNRNCNTLCSPHARLSTPSPCPDTLPPCSPSCRRRAVTQLELRGGTDADMAPPAAYLTHVLLPLLGRAFGELVAGAEVQLVGRGCGLCGAGGGIAAGGSRVWVVWYTHRGASAFWCSAECGCGFGAVLCMGGSAAGVVEAVGTQNRLLHGAFRGRCGASPGSAPSPGCGQCHVSQQDTQGTRRRCGACSQHGTALCPKCFRLY